MGLWAEAEIVVSKPKLINIKDIVVRVIKGKFNDPDETIITSTYSKEDGVRVYLRTTHIGSTFNDMIDVTISELKKENIGYFWVDIKRNSFVEYSKVK